jgi:hypothetical protein
MTRPHVVRALAAAGIVWCCRGVSAQQRPADLLPMMEVSGGIEWTAGASFGTTAANEIIASGAAFPLFSVSSEIGSAIGVEARITKRVWRSIRLEASGSYSRPELRSTTSADVENATAVTATDRLRQITIEGAVLFSRNSWRIGGRAVPFVSAGAGYLRQLHEGDTFAQTGQLYAVGGGVEFPLASRPGKRLTAVGVRADARAVVRSHAAAVDGASHASPAVSVSAYLGFAR